ncbi:MAG: hypothetical protein ACFCGT_17460 [Sandaracinaceae bacterium]
MIGPASVPEVGAEGEAVAFAGQVLHLHLPRAFAPGAPVRVRVDVAGEALGLEGKTIGSKRLDEGRFHVRVRLVNLRRAQREALVRAAEG